MDAIDCTTASAHYLRGRYEALYTFETDLRHAMGGEILDSLPCS